MIQTLRTNKGTFAAKDLTGKQFGLLTALKPTNQRGYDGSLVWRFQCACGEITEKIASKAKRIKSCGCLSKKNSGQFAPQDLASFRHFMVRAIEPTTRRDPSGYIIWKLACDCGKVFERPNV
ncbi:MAG: hypothetical protein M3209_16765 [Acidobacteriota bacterium]|nr:hypothetical protein [Acidobacteriota bacterium]